MITSIAIVAGTLYSAFKRSSDKFLAIFVGSIAGGSLALGFDLGFQVGFCLLVGSTIAFLMVANFLRVIFWGIIENAKAIAATISRLSPITLKVVRKKANPLFKQKRKLVR